MGELKEFPASGGSASGGKPTKERPNPAASSEQVSLNETEREKPANVIDIESGRKRRQMKGSIDTSSILADAFDLIRGGQLPDAKIDNLKFISKNEKTLLKVISGLFERLRKYDEEIEEFRNSNKKLKQESEQEE